MITRLIEVLRNARIDVSASEIEDAVWLAPHVPARADGAIVRPTTHVQRPEEKTQAPVRPNGEDQRTSAPPPPPPVAAVVPDLPSSDAQPAAGGVPFRAPAVRALPNGPEVVRALRPLRKRVPSQYGIVYDENATVEAIARIGVEGPWIPVVRRRLERWLELALVFDKAESMSIWGPLLSELRLLLLRMGAFRDVRVWSLVTNTEAIRLQKGFAQTTTTAQTARGANELLDAAGRRVILVISDCVSSGWRSGAVQAQLATWGRSNPVALLQVLPEELWSRTALRGSPTAQLTAGRPAAANVLLRARALADLGGLRLPVVSLDARTLQGWAGVLAGTARSWVPGVVLADKPEARSAADPAAERTGEERVRRFRGSASPMAQQLAELLSAAPLYQPVVRLVWQTMLPGATQGHMAEVFLGGLVKRTTAFNAPVDPDEVSYDFFPGVRDELRKNLASSDGLEVLSGISDFIRERTGQSLDFRALLLDPENLKGGANGTDRMFAGLATPFLRRLGGRYAELADKLERLLPPLVVTTPMVVPTPPPRAAPSVWNGQVVLVVGTTAAIPPVIAELCDRLGRLLAESGYGLVTEHWSGVDGAVRSAYVRTLGLERSRVVQPKTALIRPGLGDEPVGSSTQEAHAVVVIGGSESTPERSSHTSAQIADAFERGLLVMPLVATGYPASAALDQLRSARAPERPLSDEELGELQRPAGEGLADRVLSILKAHLLDADAPGAAARESVNENGLWILVDGTEGFGLPLHHTAIARALGRSLALGGFSLVTLGTTGVAHVATRSFLDALQRHGHTSGIHRIVSVGQRADFTWGRHIQIEESVPAAAVARADAVLFVGTSNHSEEIIAVANQSIPIAELVAAPPQTSDLLPSRPSDWSPSATDDYCAGITKRLQRALGAPPPETTSALALALERAERALDQTDLDGYNSQLDELRSVLPPSTPLDTAIRFVTDAKRVSHRLLGFHLEPVLSATTLLKVLHAERRAVRDFWETRTLWLALEAVQSLLPLEKSKDEGRAVAAACLLIGGDLEASTYMDRGGECKALLQTLIEGDRVMNRARRLWLLARQYEDLRARLPPGSTRTNQMTALVGAVVPSSDPAPPMPEAQTWFRGGSPGQRIVALGLLRALPDPAGFVIVNECIAQARSPFEQYTALTVAEWMLPRLDQAKSALLEQTILTVREGTTDAPVRIDPTDADASRWDLTVQILERLRSRWPVQEAAKVADATGPIALVLRGPGCVGKSTVLTEIQRVWRANGRSVRVVRLDDGWADGELRRKDGPAEERYPELVEERADLLLVRLGWGEPNWGMTSSLGASRRPQEWVDLLKARYRVIHVRLSAPWPILRGRLSISKASLGPSLDTYEYIYEQIERDLIRFVENAGLPELVVDTTKLEVADVVDAILRYVPPGESSRGRLPPADSGPGYPRLADVGLSEKAERTIVAANKADSRRYRSNSAAIPRRSERDRVPTDIARVTGLQDPVLRNLYISQRYHDLATLLTNKLGGPDVTWPAFATWTSKAAGGRIRNEETPGFVRDLVAGAEDDIMPWLGRIEAVTHALLPTTGFHASFVLSPIREALDVTATSIARGDRKLFAELAPLFMRFVEHMGFSRAPTPEALARFLESLDPRHVAEGGQEALRGAFTAYHRAILESDSVAKARFVLLGNCLVGLHEQIRLQPEVMEIMDVPVDVILRKHVHATIGTGVDEAVFARLVRAIEKPFSELAAVVENLWTLVATRYLMSIALPGVTIRGAKVTGQAASRTFIPPSLQNITAPDGLVTLFRQYDRSRASREAPPIDWRVLDERMNFVVNLFRSRQQDPQLLAQPFSDAQRELIELDRVPDQALGSL